MDIGQCDQIREIMHTNVRTTTPKSSLINAAKHMIEKSVGSLVVLDKEKVVGIITEKDMTKAVSEDKTDKLVKDFMSTPVITIHPDELILIASNITKKNKIKRIPVTEDEKLVGVVTQTNISDYMNNFSKDMNYQRTMDKIKNKVK